MSTPLPADQRAQTDGDPSQLIGAAAWCAVGKPDSGARHLAPTAP